FPRLVGGLCSLITPWKWFGTRKPAAIVLPEPPTELFMEVQESPRPEQLLQTPNSCDANFYKSSKPRISPLRSESSSPRNTHDSDVEEVMEGEPKLHELSDQDSSSDDDEEARFSNPQFNTPSIHGPSNLRRTSLVLKKRKLSESSE
ncbi:hypothetical protein PMAYCL1PPCAC_02559, partial [Pristionchus mayeri]